MTATVYQTQGDQMREQAVADALRAVWPSVEFWPTPKYFPTDFHLVNHYQRGSADYIGDLEVKWFHHPSSKPGVFNYNKLMRILLMQPARDDAKCYHRLAARYEDGLYVVPVRALAALEPEPFIRRDTGERDLIVRLDLHQLPGKWFDTVVTA